jgi:hypothetical protein
MAVAQHCVIRQSICSAIRSPGNFDLNPENGSYFSIDSGNRNINKFNGISRGDLSDWLGLIPDTFNRALARGQEEPFTAGDEVLMDVIDYDPAVVPEPNRARTVGCPSDHPLRQIDALLKIPL